MSLETADIALTHDNIAKLPWLICLSRRMLSIIKINIVFGLVFNAVAVVAGGKGWLTSVRAAIGHNVRSVLVVFASASSALFHDEKGESQAYNKCWNRRLSANGNASPLKICLWCIWLFRMSRLNEAVD